MSSALLQANFTNSTTIAIALIVLVLAVGLMVLLFARSNIQKREREGRVRERMLEMEREAQFAAAADQVPIARHPGNIALQIANLLRDYLSIRVLAIYAGAAYDSAIDDVLAGENQRVTGGLKSGMPASVPASLLAEYSRPAVVRLSVITGQPTGALNIQQTPAADQVPVQDLGADAEQNLRAPDAEEVTDLHPEPREAEASIAEAPVAADVTSPKSDGGVSVASVGDTVALLPWSGPFDWRGMIIAAAPEGVALGLFDPYREPLLRLTDKLAVALDFQRSALLNDLTEQRAIRTTEFSRALFSCLQQPSPWDAVVREVTKLVGSNSAALWRVDEASGMVRMVASHGLLSPEFLPLPIGQGLAGTVVQERGMLSIEDAPSDPRCIFPREARESGIVSYLAAPLASDGKSLGVIEVHLDYRRTWTEDERQALESAAAILSEVIKSTDSRGTGVRVESAYLGLSESLQRLGSAEELKEAVVEVLGHALAATRVIVAELDEQDQPQPVKQEFKDSTAKSAIGTTFGESLFAAVSESGKPVAVFNSSEESLSGTETATELGLLSELAAPILVEGKTRGIVYIHQCDRVREWEPEEIEFAERVVRQLSLSLSNLKTLNAAVDETQQARAEAQRLGEIGREAPARIQELEQKLANLERALTQARASEAEARGMLDRVSALEASARAEVDVARRVESEVKQRLESLQEEHKQAQGSAQQLLEINRLKSEFIVNAGHEMEASLQSVLGLAELLERGSYGNLSKEQREVVHSIYGWARRIKNDIDWLVEYGSARSRRLEPSEENK